tara:strand:- start:465 stop:734 length:270 start_codon:yes stop_codon:yes gene_type:complete
MTAAETPNEGTPSEVEITVSMDSGMFFTKNLPKIPWHLWNELQSALKKLNEEYFFEQQNTLIQAENGQETRLTGLKIKKVALKIERETF